MKFDHFLQQPPLFLFASHSLFQINEICHKSTVQILTKCESIIISKRGYSPTYHSSGSQAFWCQESFVLLKLLRTPKFVYVGYDTHTHTHTYCIRN